MDTVKAFAGLIKQIRGVSSRIEALSENYPPGRYLTVENGWNGTGFLKAVGDLSRDLAAYVVKEALADTYGDEGRNADGAHLLSAYAFHKAPVISNRISEGDGYSEAALRKIIREVFGKDSSDILVRFCREFFDTPLLDECGLPGILPLCNNNEAVFTCIDRDMTGLSMQLLRLDSGSAQSDDILTLLRVLYTALHKIREKEWLYACKSNTRVSACSAFVLPWERALEAMSLLTGEPWELDVYPEDAIREMFRLDGRKFPTEVPMYTYLKGAQLREFLGRYRPKGYDCALTETTAHSIPVKMSGATAVQVFRLGYSNRFILLNKSHTEGLIYSGTPEEKRLNELFNTPMLTTKFRGKVLLMDGNPEACCTKKLFKESGLTYSMLKVSARTKGLEVPVNGMGMAEFELNMQTPITGLHRMLPSRLIRELKNM